jgi:hypothetical protein
MAVGKMMVEAPILRRSMPDGKDSRGDSSLVDPAPGKTLAERMTPALWKKFAASRAGEMKLDEASRRFMISKLPTDGVRADERAAGGIVDESTPFAKTLRNFESSMAEDTVRNEYLLHGQVHEWFVAGTAPARLDDLNERVYADLFLMPKADPWLGLVPADAYTALPAGK